MASLDDDDDPVVREIPVYLSTELSDALYLIQHPHFNIARADPISGGLLGEPPLPTSARIRPLHGKLELGTAIDTSLDNPHYDADTPDRQRLTEHRSVSSEVVAQAHLAVGAMRSGAMHLTPVRRVLQMRASLAHVDEADAREERDQEFIDDDSDSEMVTSNSAAKSARSNRPPKDATTTSSSEVPVAGAGAGAAATGYQKRESDRAKHARLTSWAHHNAAELSESFLDLEVREAGSPESDADFELMFCSAAPEPAVLPLTWLFQQGVQGVARAKTSQRLPASSVALLASTRLPSAEDPWPMPASLNALAVPTRQWLLLACHAALEAHGHPSPSAGVAATQGSTSSSNGSGKSSSTKSSGSSNSDDSSTVDSAALAMAAPVPASVLAALAHGASCGALAAAEALVWMSRLEPRAGSPFLGRAQYQYLSETPNHNADAVSSSSGGIGGSGSGSGASGSVAPWGSGSAPAPRYIRGTILGDKAAAAHQASQALANPHADLPSLVAAVLASEEYAFAVHGAAYSLQEIQEDKALSLDQKVHVIMRRASVVPHDALACVALSTPQVVEPIPGDASSRVEIDGDENKNHKNNGSSSSSRSNGSSKSRANRDTSGSSTNSSSNGNSSRVHEAAAHYGVLLRGCWVVKSEALFARGGGGADAAALAALHPGSTKVPLVALVASLSAGSSGSGSALVDAGISAGSGSAASSSSSSSSSSSGRGGRSSGKGAQSSSSSSSIVVAPKASSSALTAAEEAICNARDSMLCLLHRDGYLYRAPLTSALDGALSDFQARCVLNRVADLDRPTRQWRLNRPDTTATAAESLPSHVMSNQEAQWQAMEQKSEVARILAAYDANCASLAASGKGPGPREVRPAFMIDSQPGFNPGIPGGRDF